MDVQGLFQDACGGWFLEDCRARRKEGIHIVSSPKPLTSLSVHNLHLTSNHCSKMKMLWFLSSLLMIAIAAGQPTQQGNHTETTDSVPSSLWPSVPQVEDPKLSGHHFRITVAEFTGFVTIQEGPNGELSFSGYLMDILQELAFRADFTYELLTPSGYGSMCQPRLPPPNNNTNTTAQHHPEAYHSRYRQAFLCAESDVNDRPLSSLYSTDLYFGVFYITPERLKVNKFTIPYNPPALATLVMVGTATHIRSIHDLASSEYNYNVCAHANTAFKDQLEVTFPDLYIHGLDRHEDRHQVLEDGTCDVIILAYPMAQQYVFTLKKEGKCLANGKPIGVIGEPLEYGLNHFSFGVRLDVPEEVTQTLNFWLQALMACFPEDPNGYCPNGVGSLSQMYLGQGGKGDECGYIQFPTSQGDEGLTSGLIAVIVAAAMTPVILVLLLGTLYHMRQLSDQEKRMKKRFIQQLARNIDIGDSAKEISAQKLAEAFEHIGGHDGLISKDDLGKWMADLHLDFLSEQDFDRLWDTMDMDHTGYVDPIEFCQFLSACEREFEVVHSEYDALPKSEKMKLATRRLSNYKEFGEEEVKKMERRNNGRSRFIQLTPKMKRRSTGTEPTQVFSDTSHQSN